MLAGPLSGKALVLTAALVADAPIVIDNPLRRGGRWQMKDGNRSGCWGEGV